MLSDDTPKWCTLVATNMTYVDDDHHSWRCIHLHGNSVVIRCQHANQLRHVRHNVWALSFARLDESSGKFFVLRRSPCCIGNNPTGLRSDPNASTTTSKLGRGRFQSALWSKCILRSHSYFPVQPLFPDAHCNDRMGKKTEQWTANCCRMAFFWWWWHHRDSILFRQARGWQQNPDSCLFWLLLKIFRPRHSFVFSHPLM